MPSTRRGQIEREIKGIEFMNSVGVPCPVVLHYDYSKRDIGKKYMLQEFIESDLLWEVKNSLTLEEKEYIKVQIIDILDHMKNIKGDCFGDVYENGVIGQYSTWKEAYMAMWKILLDDAAMLELCKREELNFISDVGEFAQTQFITSYTSSYYHGDLGTHNVLVNCSEGFRCIGTVIDFGNSLFLPFYMNEDCIKKYGGWDLEVVDTCKKYAINKIEYDTNNLVFDFEGTIFSSMLELRMGKDLGIYITRFLETCKQYMKMR